MNPQELVNQRAMLINRLKTLQQQLQYVNGNQAAQQQVMGQLNNTQNELQQLEAYMFQMGMLNNPQQQQQTRTVERYDPNNAYGQQQQQPYHQYQQKQQQPYVQPINQYPNTGQNTGFGTPVGNNTNNAYNPYPQNNDSDIDMDSRYSKRDRGYQKPVVNTNSIVTSLQQQDVVEEKIELTPLPGNEFPLLVAEGITSAKEIQGNYYKYTLKGNTDMSKYADRIKFEKILDDNKYTLDKSELIRNELAIIALEHDKLNIGKDTVLLSSMVADIKISDDFYINLINNSKDLLDLAKNLAAFGETNESNDYLYERLDKLLTTKLNNSLKYRAISNGTVDSFVEDLPELIEVINHMEDLAMKNKYVTVITDLQKALKYDVADIPMEDLAIDTIESEKYKLVPFVEKVSTIIINSYKTKYDIVDQVGENDTMLVTPVSHQDLYATLVDAYEELANFKATNEAELYLLTMGNKSAENYKVFKSVENSFVITNK